MPHKENSLPPIKSNLEYTLVLDLDETLVHFDPVRIIIFFIPSLENKDVQAQARCFEILK